MAFDLKTATKPELIDRAHEIRRGAKVGSAEAFKIAKKLADLQCMDAARLLAEHIHADTTLPDADRVEVRQKWALWTSKNPDAPDDSKHDDALAILDGIQAIPGHRSLALTTDPETLGIAGGICKRRWIVDGQRQSLEQSLRFYERGVEQGIATDNGYTAINAAFVQDLLASLDGEELPTARAQQLRQRVIDELLPLEDQPLPDHPEYGPRGEQRWFHETIAEAYFGLRRYDEASERLRKIDWAKVRPWEFETTARQFAWLAHLLEPQAQSSQDFDKSRAWTVLRASFGDDPARGAASLFAGKVGLALSGGGFRASFFHIGVLAALAELDMLRHVAVLSCVSGGSIIGAYYYLEIRKLLQERPDGKIERKDYIELVERVAEQFLAGVQKNIRTRIASNLWAIFRMMFVPGYTRTNRLGELYEELLYSRVPDKDENGRQDRLLRQLVVRPLNDVDCQPKYDNWKRTDKVPILVLNATTVNTGHNWQFTATWMGEPPSQIDSQVDGNYRLRRMYLKDEAPGKHKDIRLGQAVAASSCVPGLFPPLELRDLYPGKTVRLVDGGVCDNQGVFGLLDQNCTVLIVSDASGQMGTLDDPPDGPLTIGLRSNAMTMARSRVAEYRELESRRRSSRLKGLLFVHLKHELPVRAIDWDGCNNRKQLSDEQLRRADQDLTGYGILKTVQEKIAGIRTDLDSFSEVEAFALMTSGCNMVRSEFGSAITGFRTDARLHEWSFLREAPSLRDNVRARPLMRLLSAASQRAFKVWRLSPWLRGLAALLAVATLAGLGWVVWSWRDESFLTAKGVAAAAAAIGLGLLAGTLGLKALVRAVGYRKTGFQILVAAGLAVFGMAAAWLHLALFDRLFLRRGQLDRVCK